MRCCRDKPFAHKSLSIGIGRQNIRMCIAICVCVFYIHKAYILFLISKWYWGETILSPQYPGEYWGESPCCPCGVGSYGGGYKAGHEECIIMHSPYAVLNIFRLQVLGGIWVIATF